MAISGTVWPLKSRRCVQNQRRARTAGTDARKALLPDHFDDVRLGRFAHGDFRHRQMEVAAEVATLDLDVDAHFIHGAVSDRFRRCATATNFLWRADAQGAVWTIKIPSTSGTAWYPCLRRPPGYLRISKLSPSASRSLESI